MTVKDIHQPTFFGGQIVRPQWVIWARPKVSGLCNVPAWRDEFWARPMGIINKDYRLASEDLRRKYWWRVGSRAVLYWRTSKDSELWNGTRIPSRKRLRLGRRRWNAEYDDTGTDYGTRIATRMEEDGWVVDDDSSGIRYSLGHNSWSWDLVMANMFSLCEPLIVFHM